MNSLPSMNPLNEGVPRILDLVLFPHHILPGSPPSPTDSSLLMPITPNLLPQSRCPPAPDPWMQQPTGHLYVNSSQAPQTQQGLNPTHRVPQAFPLTIPPCTSSEPYTHPMLQPQEPPHSLCHPAPGSRLQPHLND